MLSFDNSHPFVTRNGRFSRDEVGTGSWSHETVGAGTKICGIVPLQKSRLTTNPDISGQESRDRDKKKRGTVLSRPLPIPFCDTLALGSLVCHHITLLLAFLNLHGIERAFSSVMIFVIWITHRKICSKNILPVIRFIMSHTVSGLLSPPNRHQNDYERSLNVKIFKHLFQLAGLWSKMPFCAYHII